MDADGVGQASGAMGGADGADADWAVGGFAETALGAPASGGDAAALNLAMDALFAEEPFDEFDSDESLGGGDGEGAGVGTGEAGMRSSMESLFAEGGYGGVPMGDGEDE